MKYLVRKAVNILIIAAILCFIGAAVFATADWNGVVSGRAFALGSVASALTAAGVVINSRSCTSTVTVAVAKAPQSAYHRGYGDCAEDVFDPRPLDDTTDLARI